MDDILGHGKMQKEHDKRLEVVLTRLIRARITLNPEKCEFSRKQLKFAGHSLSAQGIGPDPHKTAAIEKMERPQNVAELRRFLGMINHQQKFIENLSEKTNASSRSSVKQERMALGPSSRRICLSLEERNDPSASSRSLLRERNYYICRRIVVWIRSVLLQV